MEKSNIVKNYNKLFYESGPVSFQDYINNKYNIIHEELYNNALDLYLENNYGTAKDEILSKYKFIEIKDKEYYNPSKVIQIKTDIDYSYLYSYINEYSYINSESKLDDFVNRIVTIDLKPYWNNYQKDNKEKIKFNNDERIKTSKIIYFNYITGKIKLRNIYNDEEFEIDFSDYNNSLKNDSSINLSYTFTNLNKY